MLAAAGRSEREAVHHAGPRRAAVRAAAAEPPPCEGAAGGVVVYTPPASWPADELRSMFSWDEQHLCNVNKYLASGQESRRRLQRPI